VDGGDVRLWRLERGLSQEGLARLLGTTKQAVFYWESGRRKPPPMLALALEALDRRLAEAKQKGASS
jgi:DNA-binding transcriptional regulator YiaG